MKEMIGIAKKDIEVGETIIFTRDDYGEWSSEQINITESKSRELEERFQRQRRNDSL